MTSISQITGAAKNLAPSGLTKTFETVHCPMLPSVDGSEWGRPCKLKKLNFQAQIQYLGLVRDKVLQNRANREAGDAEAFASDDDAELFWNNIYYLVMACADPVFAVEDAIQWATLDEIDGINCADVIQFLLHHIRSLNDAAPGMEDLAGGMATLRAMPYALQKIEAAYLKGGNAMDLLLEGKAPGTQAEMVQFIEKWGGIISSVAFGVLRKQAKIQADENAVALLTQLIELASSVFGVKNEEDRESEDG